MRTRLFDEAVQAPWDYCPARLLHLLNTCPFLLAPGLFIGDTFEGRGDQQQDDAYCEQDQTDSDAIFGIFETLVAERDKGECPKNQASCNS